jgi:hypothetical protein
MQENILPKEARRLYAFSTARARLEQPRLLSNHAAKPSTPSKSFIAPAISSLLVSVD